MQKDFNSLSRLSSLWLLVIAKSDCLHCTPSFHVVTDKFSTLDHKNSPFVLIILCFVKLNNRRLFIIAVEQFRNSKNFLQRPDVITFPTHVEEIVTSLLQIHFENQKSKLFLTPPCLLNFLLLFHFPSQPKLVAFQA